MSVGTARNGGSYSCIGQQAANVMDCQITLVNNLNDAVSQAFK